MKILFQYFILLPIFSFGTSFYYKIGTTGPIEHHPKQEQSYFLVLSDSIPDPVVKVGNFLDTVLTVKKILLNPYLSVPSSGPDQVGKFSVYFFEMEIAYGSGEVVSTKQTGSRFSTEQLEFIKALKPGDQLHFSNLRGRGPDGKEGKYPNFTITIN